MKRCVSQGCQAVYHAGCFFAYTVFRQAEIVCTPFSTHNRAIAVDGMQPPPFTLFLRVWGGRERTPPKARPQTLPASFVGCAPTGGGKQERSALLHHVSPSSIAHSRTQSAASLIWGPQGSPALCPETPSFRLGQSRCPPSPMATSVVYFGSAGACSCGNSTPPHPRIPLTPKHVGLNKLRRASLQRGAKPTQAVGGASHNPTIPLLCALPSAFHLRARAQTKRKPRHSTFNCHFWPTMPEAGPYFGSRYGRHSPLTPSAMADVPYLFFCLPHRW